jgi:hypothetical protein
MPRSQRQWPRTVQTEQPRAEPARPCGIFSGGPADGMQPERPIDAIMKNSPKSQKSSSFGGLDGSGGAKVGALQVSG